MPAVSTNSKLIFFQFQLPTTGSWVVPAMEVASERFSFNRQFIRVDLPELGGPKMTSLNSFSSWSVFSLEELGKRLVICFFNLSKLVPFQAETVKKCCG